MPGSLHAWYGLRDLESLAERQAALEGEIEQRRLARLAESLHAADRSVRASMRFRQRAGGALIAELDYDTTVELTCQRCLESYAQPLAGHVALALLDSADAGASAPPDCEPVELDDGRLQAARLIEDELLISLPLVPKHPRSEDCGSLARRLQAAEQSQAAKAP